MLSFCSRVIRYSHLEENNCSDDYYSTHISGTAPQLQQESLPQVFSQSANKRPGRNLDASCNNQHLAKSAPCKASNTMPNVLKIFPDIGTQNGSKPRLSMKMPPSPPTDNDFNVGDLVDVPGKMYGTVRFIGPVNNKNGIFAGVELSEEFAGRGKNNGDVDGVFYFRTSVAGAGIFLPINKAIRRCLSLTSQNGSLPLTPTTPLTNGTKTPSYGVSSNTPPVGVATKFNSVRNEKFQSPKGRKMPRPSLSRPESPARASRASSRPSLGLSTTKTPARYGSPAQKRFGQSVRGTQDSRDSSRKIMASPQKTFKASIGARSTSTLDYRNNFSDDETTPTAKSRIDHLHSKKNSVASSYSDKTRPISRPNSRTNTRVASRYDENQHLRAQLEERDRRLQDQAFSLAEMENALAEVQSIMDSDNVKNKNRTSLDGKDVSQLRALIREKNEKIAKMNADFDTHRADFRSTIDTLELASAETERVYEQRISVLEQQIRELVERTEDVDSVALQLKQLEELVQELEDGLEDARRGEAEARGEVEFLRGEVERTRSELKCERDKAAKASNATSAGGNNANGATTSILEHRDDEIRGLKAIIHSLSRHSVSDINLDSMRRPIQSRHLISNSFDSIEARLDLENSEYKLQEFHSNNTIKDKSQEDLERELENLRRGSATSIGTATHDSSTVRDSKGTTVSWRDRDSRSSVEPPRRANKTEKALQNDAYSSTSESFCELCEAPGHDILICTNMFNTGSKTGQQNLKEIRHSFEDYKTAPVSPKKSAASSPLSKLPNPADTGPVAGKESGVVNLEKWCGVCEREGHDSIDCPFEDDF